ncbi:ABC transporter substrate-binding protein [Paractinoplanes lichenicola]|uniref:ABC transporter substrate-binding protein n=1 Tax=Paractinoplanes lichenicola TaxID=2802976 RepID=A0ABS1W032_9ACTN|nr:ABC transporter substrate-binding protein [Actinoplanes lichenicola]MBL7260065.1 ABC transporter substrate-binding protein [Actinoplanes lichenicola]
MKARLPWVAVAATLMISGCSVDSGGSSEGGAAAGAASPAANCAIATAADPGNSQPAADTPIAENAPKLAQKDTYRVAFSQNANNGAWRIAETQSMQDEAKRLGYQIQVTDAQNNQSKQIQDIRSLIAQKPDALFVAPMTEEIGTVIGEAKSAGIPVFLIDRTVSDSQAKAGTDYVTTIVSDFVQEGKRAAYALAKATGGTGKVIALEGTTGSSSAVDRKKGFEDALKECPGLELVATQDADNQRARAQDITESLLQANPDVTAVYAQGDDMAMGAIAAIRAAGKVPGKDILVVSGDGSKEALQAIVDGTMAANVECNPRFGPKAFEVMKQYAAGDEVPTKILNEDRLFDSSNAGEFVDQAY